MARKKQALTPARVRLAKSYAQLGDLSAAAREAGLAASSARAALYDPRVQAIIKREQYHILVTVGVPASVAALIRIVTTSDRDSAVNDAAKQILALAKVSPETLDSGPGDGASLAELELWLEERKAKNAAAARIIDAEVVEVEPAGALD